MLGTTPSNGYPLLQNWNFQHILLTYLLTPWSRVLLQKLASLQLVKKFPAFYGTRRFLTTLTSARHLSLSWASPIQSSYPNPTSWRSTLILSSHLRLGLPSGLFPSGFPTSTLYTPLLFPSSYSLLRSFYQIRSSFSHRYDLSSPYAATASECRRRICKHTRKITCASFLTFTTSWDILIVQKRRSDLPEKKRN